MRSTKSTKPELWGSLAAAAAALAAVSCTAPGGPDFVTTPTWGSPNGPGGADASVDMATPVQIGPLTCREPRASEVMAARSTIATGESRAPTAPVFFTADLFSKFKSVCGGCHVESSLGGFGVSASNFATMVDQHTIDVIKSPQPELYMPPKGSPNGMSYDDRVASDPVVQLVELLTLWIAKGRPAEKFDLPAPDGASTVAGYELSPELASALTNIGSCVPDKGMVGTNTTEMDELDTMFAKATALPDTLDKTDLFTLESEALARKGVISFAPTYPLWTDSAGKMRYVRVPRGKSIVFDKAKQQFTIPANTRFYKTFLKAVVDANGNPGFRKIETRVIVSRPDENLPDGTAHQTALFGTYVWNDDETQATLLADPLRNGKPFADRIFTYITDEQKAQPIIDAAPKNLLRALSQAGVTREYALPGAERCVQCHMGSPSQSFILGFTPLQMNRRAPGQGGLYETGAGEELTQLQRLIDYGVISGMTSPADVLPLEQSQGTRKARTPEELAAQAYMVGNCSHCHNPRGLPTIKEPALKDILNFLPGPGAHEGIFEFPLDVVSPIRKRGLLQDVDIAYITPSLYDIPGDASAKYFCPTVPGGGCQTDPPPAGEPDPNHPWPAPPVLQFVLAPWRSLIYRNVETPYDYFDDYALFPHMPLSSPSFDCRVPKIMGDWMVSIPAVIKTPSHPEDAKPRLSDLQFGDKANREVQPYREVKPGDAEYADAVVEAKARLERYHHGYRYGFCPSTYTADLTDSYIEDLVSKNLTVSTHTGPFTDAKDSQKVLMPQITPFSPHYVPFDDTDPPGDWFPRRPDWEKALVNPNIPKFVADTVKAQHLTASEAEDLTNVLEALQTVKFTPEIKAALMEELPFGLWDTAKPECTFAGIPTAGSLTGAARPAWMDVKPPAPSAPVFYQTPGAAVFTTICFNCHGLKADSKGLLAEEISTLTGGDARVANFRDGLFGPVTQPGMNRARVFGPAAATLGNGVTSDDLASRYLAWMALGGTAKHLPQDVLTQVAQAPVLGHLRANISPAGTPDMLRLGLQLCSQVATSSEDVAELPLSDLFGTGRIAWTKETGLVDSTGDAAMWLRLCTLGNRPIVHVALVSGSGWTANTSADDLKLSGFRLFWGSTPEGQDLYGANPAMDANGNLTTGIANNTFPICVPKPTDTAEASKATQWLASHKVHGNVVPFCPDGLVTAEHQLAAQPGAFTDGHKWAARGAINAALAVFLYLDQIERDPTKRKPLFNQCNLLPKP